MNSIHSLELNCKYLNWKNIQWNEMKSNEWNEWMEWMNEWMNENSKIKLKTKERKFLRGKKIPLYSIFI